MEYYTTPQLLNMTLEDLQGLHIDQLIDAICTLEVTIYLVESMDGNYSKEASLQRTIKSIIRKRAHNMAMSY